MGSVEANGHQKVLINVGAKNVCPFVTLTIHILH
jgi:hypothetical protein